MSGRGSGSGSTVSRLPASPMRNRLRRLRPLIIGVLVVGLLAFAGWVVLLSTWLATESVTVEGEHLVSQDEVLAAADIDLGTPMLRVDLDAASARVAQLPAVASVSVHRSWPHTVSISVQERQPVATLHRDEQWWAVDSHGVLFRPTPERDASLVLLKVSPQAGEQAVHEAASVAAALPQQLMDTTRRLSAESMDSITLELHGDRSVLWGSSAESHRKVEVLIALLDAAPAHRYDVSVPGLPTTRG